MPRKALNGAYVAVDRIVGVVAKLQFSDHPFAEFGHERPPSGRSCISRTQTKCSGLYCHATASSEWRCHSRVANLLPADQTTFDSLSQCLADEISLHCVSLDQVKDRPQGSRKLEALRRFYVALGEVRIVQQQDSWNLAVAEICQDCHVELRRIRVRQVIWTERRLVTIDTLYFLVPISRPECPKHKIRSVGRREQGESVDAAIGV